MNNKGGEKNESSIFIIHSIGLKFNLCNLATCYRSIYYNIYTSVSQSAITKL